MLFDTRPKVAVHVAQTGEQYPCASNESLLRGMLRLGRKGIPAGCVNGGCGVCKVRILDGEIQALGPISRAHVTLEEERQGYTLACRVAPQTAVHLEVAGKLNKPFSKGRAEPATERPIPQQQSS
ncbi:MAG: 2Fe-2S iron-sulfur cluster binding domain-containing protein [Hydrogenophaga sp.]|uniref:2Fe-2S iron-sulfur cluster binding domain-containing protein n=1 Tax=Hydrogenophaga sp. TaxID=1904254 RepID=UPI00271EC313|nr:2Fe-2S iron-sulfur cluster binding domain-containing protein [Hydrogenophaga sp.]MDO9029971.1 2Fe-2S iron-sulfur cluster binding domain-containing protein [Hydrogenophaga sp.]